MSAMNIYCLIRKKTISVFKNENKRSEELMQIKGDLGDRLKANVILDWALDQEKRFHKVYSGDNL